MSSEDKTVEPSDRGPSPPPSSTGVTATGSPANTDKRPRGRPRKDAPPPAAAAAGGGAATPLPQTSPTATPTATAKNRKKGRSKGRSAVDEEDSMDGSDITQFTETQMQLLETVEDQSASLSQNQSPTQSSVPAHGDHSVTSRERLCAFCYCGNRSLLGQGELHAFSVSLQLFSHSSDGERSSQPLEAPTSSGHKNNIGSESCEEEADPDELSHVGLPKDLNVQSLFESGQCWAHQRCALWSDGVCEGEGQSLLNVDRAIDSGSTKHCAYCKRLGASMKCCADGCAHLYHYPCAGAAGTFQDIRSLLLLCPQHVPLALHKFAEEVKCVLCDSAGDLQDQLFCTSCGLHYHGMCLDMAVTPLRRAGWQCPDCKVCQTCKNPGEDTKMLVCDMCDKGYHTFCLQPAIDSLPTNGWRCKKCRVCVQCGTRTSNHWHHASLLCDSCVHNQDPALGCPTCACVLDTQHHKDLLFCQTCKRWLHLECERQNSSPVEINPREDYLCSHCRPPAPAKALQGQEPSLAPASAHTHCEAGSPPAPKHKDLLPGSTLTPPEMHNHPKLELVPVPLHSDPEEAPAASQEENQEENQELAEVVGVQLQDSVEALQIEEPVEADTDTEPPPSTKDLTAIISSTKDLSTASALFTEQPMEGSLDPSPHLTKDLAIERGLSETFRAEKTDVPPSSRPSTQPSLALSCFSSSENSVERLEEMVSSSLMESSLTLSNPHSSIAPPTLISFTPKIGMGKPAISKRKFSPGRPRVKQGAWSPHSGVGSPLSWSPDQPECWDVSKSRPSSGSPGWSIRVGRGSGFPGRRRPRGAGLSGRTGRGRARGRNGASPSINPGISMVETLYPMKEEEDTAMHNTVVIFSSNDSFTLKQDMCVVCGSFGLGAEGRLLACAQCGQCYHPFCVGLKITKVLLSKGWRCLECTVCEACGEATDPGRLLLCDDCDISYHTYCLDPPLHNVPKDSWKCKWCVCCTQCGSTSPGVRCEWQNNYTQCGPCSSLVSCPLCLMDYSEGTIIIQCRQCDRWFHGSCQSLHSEEDVEKAAELGFDCTMCGSFRTSRVITKTRDILEPLVMAPMFPKVKEMDLSKTYTQDGVCLTESGLCQLQSLSATASRRRKAKPKLKLKIINQNSVAVLQAPVEPLSEHSRDEDLEDNREAELLDCEAKSDSSLEREPTEEDHKGPDEGKKRKRKPYRPGIGGFMVRQRSRPGQGGGGKAKRSLCRKDSSGSVSENPPGKDEGWMEMLPDTSVDETPPQPEVPEKIKKRYRKKKTKLEEAFPTYLQEAFFGKELLDKSKQSRQQGGESALLEDGQAPPYKRPPTTSFSHPSEPLMSSSGPRTSAAQPCEEPLVDLCDVLNTDADILGMLGKASSESGLDFCSFQVDSSPPPFAGLDMGPLADPPSVALQSQAGRRIPRTLPEEPLDGILSPELDKMVTDELEGKDVEDLFTAVLSPSTIHPPSPRPTAPPPAPPHSSTGSTMFPRMPMMNGMMGPNQRFPLHPGAGARACIQESFSSLSHMPFSDNPRDRRFNQMPRDAGGPWPPAGPAGPPGAVPEGETEAMSNAQRSTLKWEKEETLGEMATVAPVLYTNINFPNIKEEYPEWSTRVKQIAKLWRKASTQDRAPYVQKARDNRAALRINKVQMSNEPVKRHHPPQQPPEVFDPNIPLDTDLLFKDPLKPKESEHEQEWKFRQQMRQKSKQQAKIEATQKLEQVKNEQLQQQQLQQQQQCNLSEGDGNNSGNQSPASLPSNGSMSPMQQISRTPGPEDVFLRPPPPPPTGPSSQPQSPQVFSPSTSRPSSPWDPYAKMVGTPRPPALGPNSCRRIPVESGKSPTLLLEERGRPSPAHEAFGSPTSMSNDPYAKPPDTPRPSGESDPFLKPIGPPRGSQAAQGRPPMGSPGRDPYSRPMIRNDVYQRMAQNRMILSDPYSRPLLAPIPGSNESGSVPLFKTPMPPPQSQDPFNRPGSHPADRFLQNQQTDPYIQPPHTPRPSGSDGFTSPPRMAQHPLQGHSFAQPGPVAPMLRNPYAHAPSTPRPDHFTYDPFATPNKPTSEHELFFEPYARPPGTPRPHAAYAQQPTTLSPSSEPYSQATAAPRPTAMGPFHHGQRMSPSHSADPYTQPPGTPRPTDRFSQSPATQRAPVDSGASRAMLSDPYAPPPGTPRPGTMMGQDPFSPTQGRIQDPFPHPDLQTSKHPGEEGFIQSPSRRHDPFEQAPMMLRPHANDKMDMKEQLVLANNGCGLQDHGQLPNNLSSEIQGGALAESEERLRQRQRIRELILKQQQQRSAIRQDRGPQDPSGKVATGCQRPWPQEGDAFNRPPPPYPGAGPIRSPVRFPGPYPGDQRLSFPSEGQMSRALHPGDPSLRLQGPRFTFPHGQQEFFPRGPDPVQDVPPQMRRSMFPLRGMAMQQHSIMGQPFIELRHRTSENRQRLPFPRPPMMDPNMQGQRSAGFPRFPRMNEPMSSHSGHLQLSGSIENLHQQSNVIRSISHAHSMLPAPPAGHSAAGGPAVEEKLDGEESAVKDLEDVEVKDLVDADLENLNLDPEDGKDLDLETNDLHLDDFLTSGKFDIIAYTDPDLDDIKKDMFNEELELSDHMEENAEGPGVHRSTSSETEMETGDQGEPCSSEVKQEAATPGEEIKSEVSESDTQQAGLCDSTPVLSSLLIKQQPEENSLKPIMEPLMDPQHASSPAISQTSPDRSGDASMASISAERQAGLDPGADQAQPVAPNQGAGPQQRPLLLEEQPLLLQDLLDQERQEQQQQRQMQAMIRQRSTDTFFPNIDFDSITDPIMKAKMVALKGINKVMVQNNMGMSPMVMNRFPLGPGPSPGPGPGPGPGSAPGPPCSESAPLPPQVVGQDGKLTQVPRPTPPNFGPGFVNHAQRAQYEEWLQETQQLLQMQQKFLEEKIGTHRKSKKALSAKQRTAKKAGREFPEEDAEQLRHITEQQGMVQKQLEQIRKQQKEHAELIEEYRVKQQQNNLTPLMHPMPGPGDSALVQPPMMQLPLHPNQQALPPRVPGLPPGWHPGGPVPMGGPGMPPMMPPQGPMVDVAQHPQACVEPPGNPPPVGGVKFDDNNPFSEGFQERERRERLREQQERQRVQLMQEVERQRALKHRMEMEQQGLMVPAPLTQMPFFNTELPQDFMQPQRQQQMFPQEQMGSPPGSFLPAEHRVFMGNGRMPPDVGPENVFPQGPHRPRPYAPPGSMVQMPGEETAMPLASNFPGSGQSLIQLYSNIIPDEKGKKKRNRKKKKDDDADSVKTPSTPHSDLTAPLTPCVSDTSSTPTRNPHLFGEQDLSRSPLLGSSTPGHSELERQLSGGQSEHDRILSNIKLEQTDVSECHASREALIGSVKVEGGKGGASPFSAEQSPSKGEAGNELLKHLLKNKSTPPPAVSQRSEEEEEPADCKSLLRQNSIDSNGAYSDGIPDFPGPLHPEQEKKKGRNKRATKGGEKAASRYKKRKKDGDERQMMHSGPDSVMIKQQLSLLPLMEPLIGVSFAHFAPYGSGQLTGDNLLTGTFGSASLDGVSDYYSQLAYKQSNLSNPPTPPASLPPTPPPVNRQKMINGFATTEELASKAASMVSKGLGPKPLHVPFRTEDDLLARAIAQGPKTVDVPASLPTPPHNNQEELSNRGQEPIVDRDMPDSFVPSSSPESVAGTEISRYPDLSLVKEEPPSPCLSPVLPLLPPPDGKGSQIKVQDIKTEPFSIFFGSVFGPMSHDSKQGLVSVAITLRPAAAENITGVVSAISDLLCVKIPSSYEVSSTPDPRGCLTMMGGSRMEPQHPVLFHGHGDMGDLHRRMIRPSGAAIMMQHQFRFHPNSPGAALARGGAEYRAPGSPGCRPQWCCHCKVVVLGNGVQKAFKDLPAHMKESKGCLKSEEDLVFCSHSCFLLYCSSPPQLPRTTTEQKVCLGVSDHSESMCRAQHQYSNNMSSLDVHCLARLQPKHSPPSTPPPPFLMSADASTTETKSEALRVTVKLKARPRSTDGWHQGKRQKGLRWRKWSVQVLMPRGHSQLPDEDKIDELLKKLGASLRPPASLQDQRRCCFCHQFGDGVTDGPARLLNLDLDAWVHLNCALWSTEVYETQAGALINVELALRRGRTLRCVYCQRTGATSGCHRLRCTNVYHFTCALQAHCTFFKDKTMLCHAHRPRGTAGHALEHELRCFAVFRRVYVQRDEVRQIATAVQQPELGYTFRVGSLVLHAIGQLTPPQMELFHSPTAIFPVGYEACRIYWSMRHSNRRCRYLCSVEEREGLPEFAITVIEQGYQDLVLTDSSAKGVWDQVLAPVADKRSDSGTLQLFPVYLKGEDLFGLTVPAVTKISESLPGVQACRRYSFRYGPNPLIELPLVFNPAGSARVQPISSSASSSVVIRPQPQALSSSNTRSNQNVAQGEGGAPHSKPPVVHPRSSQYRWMKSEWRANVYLGHSRIQGLGLFAARDIEKQTMIIEYNGTVLRNEVAIRKQNTYRSQNRAVFMFRIDSQHVVDATRSGGLARYINHSCAPNCVAEVVTFERGYKIIISSIRRIDKGEELCLDYQCDAGAGPHSMTCHCGAAECRKWIH
ncbi:histone-lysine N-methyltransferase 2C isoform X3 [Gouania willdenowi]|uniref:histone-lysine N-methyltransferase 2C isoform X3 n=1 Tax=Gouania willdenowi TaxID=441366 RepID=UPI00105433BB|nr:histone-lysine N-methyltransferase 2C-like isoform X3 [Gouania willdenowi]